MINNIPAYATEYRFIVYTVVDGEKWFYGAYNDITRARDAAEMVEGYIA